MNRAQKHIIHFNRLNGKPINKTTLIAFQNAIKADIKSRRIDAHMPYGIEAIEIEKRLGKAIDQLNNHDGIEKLNIKPVKVHGYEKVKHIIPEKRKKTTGSGAKKAAIEGTSPQPVKEILAVSKADKAPKKLADVKPITAPKAKPKVNGLIGFEQIGKLSFKKIPLDGRYKNDFGSLYSDTKLMIWGSPGEGKTVYTLLFAQYLAEKMGLYVLYLPNEEMNRSTLTDKVNEFKIGHKNLKCAKSLSPQHMSSCNIDDFDAIFFDSVQTLGMNLEDYKKFAEEHTGQIHVLIIQSTKDGDFRGGKDWEHEVDIAGEIKNRKFVPRKNRLDKEFSKKQEKLNIDEIVREAEKKKKLKETISKKVKTETVPS